MQRTFDNLSEDAMQRALDYIAAACWVANKGRNDFRIAHVVAIDHATKGFCDLRTKSLARTFGTTRKTICVGIRRLLDADVIRLAGHTDDGRPMYVPNYGIVDGGAHGE